MSGRRMSTTRRLRIFERARGLCHICERPIDGTREAWEAEHVIPYALTRDDSDANLAPAHVACHARKTKGDVSAIAKAKRVAAKFTGAYRPRSTLPGSKASGLKRTIDGRILRRDDQ